VSTAFAGVSIYAQTDDSESTTFEEEAITTSEDAAEDGDTSITDDVLSLFEGLQVCDMGTAKISDETEIASVLAEAEDTTSTVSVEIMTEAEIAELASEETETADDETSTTPAECVLVGGDDAASTASDEMQTGGSETSITSAPESDEEILVIEGQDFVAGQVVLMFSENALIGIDDVEDGSIKQRSRCLTIA
jgi:hypothetical protein